MLFNSLAFIVFFILVFVLYWSIPSKYVRIQNILLLIASYVFYGWWDWRFLSLILFSTIVDYFLGLKIYNAKAKAKTYLVLSICTNLGLLGIFKYFNFFIESWVELWKIFGYDMPISTLNIILPVGISFYTFQTMSYSIDIYRKELKPTRDFISFATFVSLFPQLVAGPIERASNLIHQIEEKRYWTHKRLQDGIFQISIGFFRKVVVADSIGALIDTIYNSPDVHNSSSILMAVILYSFQIYFDFSGYSDIAIGTAKLLGFDFKQNFNLPYFSSSITEFWRRWHISLSTWFRDYVYIPLGGSRVSKARLMLNILIVFLVSGLWHGANLTFVFWGLVHAVCVIPVLLFIKKDRTYKSNRLLPTLPEIFRIGITFFIVTIASKSSHLRS